MARSTQTHWLVRAAGLGLSVLALLTGCGPAAAPGSDSVRAGTGSGDAAGKGPWNLIGSWLLDADGERTGTVLRLGKGDLSLWRNCGALFGSWRADENALFVGDVYGWSGSCDNTSPETPTWLIAAVGFVITDDGASLLDVDGHVVARLRPGGRPTAPPNSDPSMAEPPRLTERVRRAFQPAEPLPAGLAAAEAGSLVGAWSPVEDSYAAERQQPVRLEIKADGSYLGFDGCSRLGGRWVAGDEGAVLATTSLSTLFGCKNGIVGDWFAHAHRAGFDNDVLVLLDRNGHETGRLRRG